MDILSTDLTKTFALALGAIIGSLILIIVCVVYFKKRNLGWGGSLMAIIGLLLLGLSICSAFQFKFFIPEVDTKEIDQINNDVEALRNIITEVKADGNKQIGDLVNTVNEIQTSYGKYVTNLTALSAKVGRDIDLVKANTDEKIRGILLDDLKNLRDSVDQYLPRVELGQYSEKVGTVIEGLEEIKMNSVQQLNKLALEIENLQTANDQYIDKFVDAHNSVVEALKEKILPDKEKYLLDKEEFLGQTEE